MNTPDINSLAVHFVNAAQALMQCLLDAQSTETLAMVGTDLQAGAMLSVEMALPAHGEPQLNLVLVRAGQRASITTVEFVKSIASPTVLQSQGCSLMQ